MNNDEIKKLVFEYTESVKKARNAISQLETDIAIVQTGDTKGPYWSGNNAYSFAKNCLSQIEHDDMLLKNLEKNVSYLNRLSK